MQKNDRIFVAGHRGMVGSAILRRLEERGYRRILVRTHEELDLRRQETVERFFETERPAGVFLAAARVGGIGANAAHPAPFLYDNLAIGLNVIHAAWRSGVKMLLNLGSSCIYPRLALQPLREEYLLSGALEPTNEAYAVAKIAAIKLCRYYNRQYGTNFLSLMPTNLYGPNDNFDLDGSHVLAAMIRKLHLGKLRMAGDLPAIRADLAFWSGEDRWRERPEGEVMARLEEAGIGAGRVVLWGTGRPRREFLHVDDLAEACLFAAEQLDSDRIGELLNVGVGEDLTINDLAQLVRRTVQYPGEIDFDPSKPDGTPRKLLDVTRMNSFGWKARISLEEGIICVYRWYQSTVM